MKKKKRRAKGTAAVAGSKIKINIEVPMPDVHASEARTVSIANEADRALDRIMKRRP